MRLGVLFLLLAAITDQMNFLSKTEKLTLDGFE